MQNELTELLTGILGELERPTGTLREPSGGTSTIAAWIALVNHLEPLGVLLWGQVWGILALAFSPGLDSKRLDFFFDAASFSFPPATFLVSPQRFLSFIRGFSSMIFMPERTWTDRGLTASMAIDDLGWIGYCYILCTIGVAPSSWRRCRSLPPSGTPSHQPQSPTESTAKTEYRVSLSTDNFSAVHTHTLIVPLSSFNPAPKLTSRHSFSRHPGHCSI